MDERITAVATPELGTSDLSLVLWSCPQKQALLRSHIYDWLAELMGLVYHLVSVERKRKSWMHRVIHDLAQPLQGLVVMGSEIRRLASLTTASRRDIENYAEDMETSIIRLKVLLQIFGSFARIEPKPVLKPIQIENDVLRPIRRLLSPHARKNEVQISQTYAYELIPAIQSDPDLLSIVFYNLLDNAIKYSNRGSQISIGCSQVGKDYFIEVTSVGRPILDEDIEHLFEEHYRGKAVRDYCVGLGMGLTISRAIARSLSCDVELVDPHITAPKVSFRVRIPKEMSI
jgi:signal transduction histidine kinase